MVRHVPAASWLLSAFLLPSATTLAERGSAFGQPTITDISGTCAAIEFTYDGAADLSEVTVFAKRPRDLQFVQWGAPLSVRRVRNAWNAKPVYRVLMRNLPLAQKFQVKVSSGSILSDDLSLPSESAVTLDSPVVPVAPSALQLHRSDPRLNTKKYDESVCVDLHWSHPQPELRSLPGDVYFRIRWHGVGEPASVFCEDNVGRTSRSCGVKLGSVQSALPSSYATICSLRPNRTLEFSVEAINCDLQLSAARVEADTPPSAPDFVMVKVTEPANQESIAGFHPMVALDWVPQNDPLIRGHAVYLGLADVSAMKLLCWIPVELPGHLELPIVQRNYTHAQADQLVEDYWNKHSVHQEQVLFVATRTVNLVNGVPSGFLESPASSHRMGGWLVIESAIKCLTSFDAEYPAYVSHPVVPSWTQEQALAVYD